MRSPVHVVLSLRKFRARTGSDGGPDIPNSYTTSRHYRIVIGPKILKPEHRRRILGRESCNPALWLNRQGQNPAQRSSGLAEDFFREQLADQSPTPSVARIVEEQRGAYRVAGDFEGWAEVSGRYRHERAGAQISPRSAIGSAFQCRRGPIARSFTRRLDRRSTISRKAAGRAVEEQIVAANVDTIFLVTAVGHDLNPRRIERYLTVVREAGAVPVVVLNKTDLSEDAAQPRRPSRASAVRRYARDQRAESDGLEALNAYLQPAQTVALIGSSGVGKSTLVNRLMGQDL